VALGFLLIFLGLGLFVFVAQTLKKPLDKRSPYIKHNWIWLGLLIALLGFGFLIVESLVLGLASLAVAAILMFVPIRRG